MNLLSLKTMSDLDLGPRSMTLKVLISQFLQICDSFTPEFIKMASLMNAMRLEKKTPCQATSFCQDCSSPDRICNTWTITEKAYPKQRVKILLINEDLGF